jgi:long-chain acyl-CoA synthetase
MRIVRSAAYDARPWLRFYPPGVPVGVDVPPLPLTALLEEAARDFGRVPALTFLGRTTSYRRLAESVDLFAGSLTELGIRRGDRIALVLPNCPQFVIAFFAALQLGAVVVPPDLGQDALRERLLDCSPRLTMSLARSYEGLAGAMTRGADPGRVVVTTLAECASVGLRVRLGLPLPRCRRLRRVVGPRTAPADPGVLSFGALLEGSPGPVPGAVIDAQRDLAVLSYTAGTTGRARAAMLTHQNLVMAACQAALWDPYIERGAEATLLATPLHTPHGLVLGLVGGIFAASTLVLSPTDDPEFMTRFARDWGPSTMPATPETYERIVAWGRRSKARRALRTVRTSLSFGHGLPESVAVDVRRIAGIRAAEAYGLAEACGVALANPLNANARPGTAGIPLPATEVRIVDDRDPGQVVPVGSAGELAIRGPQVCRGYWNRQVDTAAAFRGGWLLTGDIAVMSPDGYVTIIDRKSDMVVTSGYVVFPAEVEWAVRRHPGVADCAVVGVPDGHAGQALSVSVVPAPAATVSADGVRQTCARYLPPYMIPREVRLVTGLPRTRNGSVLRRLLRLAATPEQQSGLPKRQQAGAT